MKFKKGDVVVCVNNKYHNRQLEIGKEYTIFSINYHSIILRELNQYVGCAKSSFEKPESIRRRKLNKIKNEIRKRRQSNLC